jgi:hypothetical protein
VEALARLQLLARGLGREIRLHRACGRLQELLDLTGLSDVVPLWGGLAIEVTGQAEQGEQAGRVEEETDPHDLAF